MKNLYKGLLVTIWSVWLWLGVGALVSAQTPVLLKSGTVDNIITTPNGLFFNSGGFLWRTDGTPAGTVQVKNAANQSVASGQQLVINGRLYFGSGPSLMYIDASGIAQPVSGVVGGIGEMIAFDNQLYFTSNGKTLWRTYGDGAQAIQVSSLPLITSRNFSLAVYKGQLYFIMPKISTSNIEASNNITLFRTNVPSTNILEVKDIPFISYGAPAYLQALNGTLYIGGSAPTSSGPGIIAALYRSDGTATGTVPVAPPANLDNYTDAFLPKVENNQLYLIGYQNFTSLRGPTSALYRVNSANNTIDEASDVTGQLPSGVLLFRPGVFTYYNGFFYYSAGTNRVNNVELWRSDGTLVKDIQPGPGTSDPQNLYVFDGKLYFSATASFIGRIMYRSDGTAAGTQPVTDITGSFIYGDAVLFSYRNETYLDGNGGLYKLTTTPPTAPTSPVTTSLTLATPTYDCNTGQLSLSTTGGNGTPVEYRIAGLRDFSASPAFSVPAYQRNGTTFTLEARQSGIAVSAPFLTACQSTTTTPPTSPTQPTGTGLSLATPTYDCNVGQLTLATTGGNGSPIDYRIAGLRDYGTSPTFTVPAYQRTGTSFTLEARQSGVVVTLPFTSACQSATTTPPTSPTQPTGGTLSVSAQPLNCQTGTLQLTTTGGDGTPIDYKVPGLHDYSASATFTVPAYQRSNTTFTLYARQGGREVTATYAATCPVSARLASAETGSQFEVVVYPNPVGEQFTVGVSGAAGQAVLFHLTNINGQTMVEQRAQVVSDAHTETLKLPASGAGLYLLQVSTESQSRTVKVLKP